MKFLKTYNQINEEEILGIREDISELSERFIDDIKNIPTGKSKIYNDIKFEDCTIKKLKVESTPVGENIFFDVTSSICNIKGYAEYILIGVNTESTIYDLEHELMHVFEFVMSTKKKYISKKMTDPTSLKYASRMLNKDKENSFEVLFYAYYYSSEDEISAKTQETYSYIKKLLRDTLGDLNFCVFTEKKLSDFIIEIIENSEALKIADFLEKVDIIKIMEDTPKFEVGRFLALVEETQKKKIKVASMHPTIRNIFEYYNVFMNRFKLFKGCGYMKTSSEIDRELKKFDLHFKQQSKKLKNKIHKLHTLLLDYAKNYSLKNKNQVI